MYSTNLSAEESKLIHQYINANQDLDELAAKICGKIKNTLGISRTHQQIRQFMLGMLHFDQKAEEQGAKVEPRLFKTFDNSNKIFQSPSLPTLTNNLARPVARRKNTIFFTSRRKIVKKQLKPISKSNWTLQQRLDELEHINQQCTYNYDKYDRKSSKKASYKQQGGTISANILWFYNEYFYSNYDKRYFDASPFVQICNQLNLNKNPSEFTLKNFKNLQEALPKPRVFNQQLVAMEKNKLEEFRNACRINTKNLSKNNESNTDFPVHSVVLALHPLCGHLHVGTIMAYYKQNLFMVRFHKPELPTNKILDVNMSTQFISWPNSSNGNHNKTSNTSSNQNDKGQQQDPVQSELTQSINYETTGYLIKILAYKNELIKLLKSINDSQTILDKKENVAPEQFEVDHQNNNIPDTNSKEVFLWAVTTIKKLDELISLTLVNFRLRGINQTNQSVVFSNIKNLLMNPLKLMSKQFQNSNEQSDVSAAQQIKEIINKQRENQIKKVINNAILQANMSQNCLHSTPQKVNQQGQNVPNSNLNHQSLTDKNVLLNQIKHNQSSGKNIQPKMLELIHSCLGILADLKYEGKDFDYENNQYLIKLANISGKQNSQAFNQVYERLFSIVNKVRE